MSPDPDSISVVIAARNAASTIEQTLISVFRQTSACWEIIVVDDGSTDDTTRVVEKWAASDSRVQLIRQAPHGVSAARNRGLRAARFVWVLFLDADDRVESRYFEHALTKLSGSRFDGVRCGWAYESSTGVVQPMPYPAPAELANLFSVTARTCPFAIHACIVRRGLVIHVGGFDEDLVVGEDWDLWQRLARTGIRLGVIPDVQAIYVLRVNSASRRDFAREISDMARVVRRGHSTDERVRNPLSEWTHGAPSSGLAAAICDCVMWTFALAAGGPFDSVAKLLGSPELSPCPEFGPNELAYELFSTVPLGRGRVVAEWPSLWPSVESEIEAAIEAFFELRNAPRAARSVRRRLQRLVATTIEEPAAVRIGHTLTQLVDIAEPPRTINVPDGVEQLVLRVARGSDVIGFATVAVLDSTVTGQEIVDAIRRQLATQLVRRALKQPGDLRRLALTVNSRVARDAVNLLLDLPARRGAGGREMIKRFARAAASGSRIAPLSVGGGDAAIVGDNAPVSGDQAFWESIFDVPDPWGYTNNYEQLKYTQTLSLIEGMRIDRALELACAEGHFTMRLAPHVGHLVAADISATALERAALRCVDHTNVEYQQLDLRNGALPQDLDLIMCSEVLYYLEPQEVSDLAGRIRDALRPDGVLVMAHAQVLTDQTTDTGFDWGHPYGAKGLGEIFAGTSGLRFCRELRSDLYRIQLFERTDPESGPGEAPQVAYIPYAQPLEPQVSRMVVWGGMHADRDQVWRHEVTDRLPILMYHSVAVSGAPALERYRIHPDRLEEQLQYLRQNAYYGITLEQWAHHLATRRAPNGRAVMLTFDDGYEDFYTNAWPLLEAYKFPATVFLVSELVGKSSDWDSDLGEPMALLDWPTIRRLQENGIEFGSHTRSHRALTTMAPREALADERAARQTFGREIGRSITSLAYPFGDVDEVTRQAMRAAGYRIGLETSSGFATVWDDPMAIPRIEVAGSDDLAAFIGKLGSSTPRSALRIGLRHVRSTARRMRGG
ncbi:MAG: trifunctional glycosyltransferase/class I SAM-dependent methyltransferase/polysaccharide deacetylase [Acidimicrobiales bacterium]